MNAIYPFASNIAAHLDVPQPETLDLLTKVRVNSGRRVFEGQVIGRTFWNPMLYDVLGDEFHGRGIERSEMTVLALPDPEQVAKVIPRERAA